MVFMVASDLIENIVNGLYLLFNHNSVVLAYFFGLLVCAIISFLRPSRAAFAITASFAILVFSFEYDKHIIEPLRTQTLATIIPTQGTHLKATKIIDLFLSELLPVIFYLLGWGLLTTSIALTLWNRKGQVVMRPTLKN